MSGGNTSEVWIVITVTYKEYVIANTEFLSMFFFLKVSSYYFDLALISLNPLEKSPNNQFHHRDEENAFPIIFKFSVDLYIFI